MKKLIATAATAMVLALPASAPADWTPDAFASEQTLELLTVGPDEGEHWFKVWLVVLDGNVYVRLGSRAAARVRRNTRHPFVSVRIAGQEFPRVRAETAPEMVTDVAEAMAEKYWSDVIMRRFDHPLTMRLTAEKTRQASQ